MPVGKSGKHYFNPSRMRSMNDEPETERAGYEPKEAAVPENGDNQQKDHAHADMVELHHPDGAENPSPGKHHTVTHHADGKEEHTDHSSKEEAMQHVDHMLGEESPAMEQEEEAVLPGIHKMAAGKLRAEDDGAY